MQPEAFNLLDKKAEADKLHQFFPDGCCLATVRGKSNTESHSTGIHSSKSYHGGIAKRSVAVGKSP